MEKMATDNRGLNARQAILQGSTFVLSMYICSKLGICTFYPCPASSPKPLVANLKNHQMEIDLELKVKLFKEYLENGGYEKIYSVELLEG